ncbi:ATP-binding protein [Kineococcus gypseus]|uniref:ATP-binding protein n=1 Tax=Kineococcus gypseus TaxID=1637102 RepID=UPI003D7F0C62
MTAVPPGAPPLVGRAAELAVLRAALGAARAGTAGTALVEADAGVGKTRLVDELVHLATADGDVTALLGHCASAGGGALPYLPFVEALAPLQRDTGAAWWSARDAAGELAQLQLFDAVAGLLAAAARERTVLLVLEDLHWADGATLDLLTHLVRRTRDERLLLVGTVRTDDVHRRHPLRPVLAELGRLPTVRRVALRPFTAQETRSYLTGLAGADVPAATARGIHERAEGNAYYAGELLLASSTGRGAGRGGAPLPEALADVVLARVEALPGEAAEVVRTAAAGGRRVRHDLLRAASGLDEDVLDRGLRDAVALRVLDPDGEQGYRFRHALLHEAVYSDLLPGERARRHAAYARALAAAAAQGRRLGAAADLAHHARAGNDLPGALSAGLLAADEAERLSAPDQAWRHLEDVLQLWDAVPDAAARAGASLTAVTLRASRLAGSAGETTRAVALARAALDALEPGAGAAQAAEAHRRLAVQLWAADRTAEALAHARRAVELVGAAGADPAAAETACWATAVAARCLYQLDDPAARDEALAARELAVRHGVPGAEADALITLGGLDNLAGALADADAWFAAASATARRAGHLGTSLRADYNRAADRYDRGDLAGALEVLDASCAWARAAGLSWAPYGVQLLLLQATACFVTGRFARAEGIAGGVGPQGPRAVASAVAVVAAHVAAATGHPARARELAGGLLDDPADRLTAAAAVAEADRWDGHPRRAARLLAGLVEDLATTDPAHLMGLRLGAQAIGALADARDAGDARADDDATGARLLHRVEELARTGQPRAGTLGPEGRAWVLVARAEGARLRGAGPADLVAAWSAAVDGFGYGAVYEAARCRRRLAEALVAAGRREEGLEQLHLARASAAELGAAPLAAALDALAHRVRALPGAAAGPLTAREAQVLELLAEGLTNRQVGERLFLAEKTASVHVSRILAKLGASSRAEAVSIALRGGLLAGGR